MHVGFERVVVAEVAIAGRLVCGNVDRRIALEAEQVDSSPNLAARTIEALSVSGAGRYPPPLIHDGDVEEVELRTLQDRKNLGGHEDLKACPFVAAGGAAATVIKTAPVPVESLAMPGQQSSSVLLLDRYSVGIELSPGKSLIDDVIEARFERPKTVRGEIRRDHYCLH
jgi:hypothetical protein